MKIKYTYQEQIGDAVMAIMGFFWNSSRSLLHWHASCNY